MLPLRAYAAIAAALSVLAMLAGAYAKGRDDGYAVQAAEYAQERAEAHAKAEAERAAVQDALDARTAELARKTEEAAHAVAQVRTEYLPGKTLVKREVVRDVVYRDCRITPSVRESIDAALRGRPAAAGRAEGAADARLSL
jgi:hypothetical protein